MKNGFGREVWRKGKMGLRYLSEKGYSVDGLR